MTYGFREGFRSHGVKADVVVKELERVKKKDGDLTAAGVFNAARPENAPLHPEFEWDGEAAVRELGLMRARQLIRAVVEIKGNDEAPSRVYVHVPDVEARAGTYEKMEVVVKNVDDYERALMALQRKADEFADAIQELRHAADGTDNQERLAAIGLAVQGFATVREALAILR